MRKRRKHNWVQLALLIAALVGSMVNNARGQSGSEAAAAAELLFTTARTLLDQKRYEEACPKLEESQRLDPGVGTLMYLGHCYEQIGRHASAWSTYRAAQSAALQVGQLERSKIARQRADELEPRLARIVVQVPKKPPPGLKVVRDGIVLGRASFGLSVPVDPGKHVVEATAPGRQSFATQLSIAPGETGSVEIAPLEPARSARQGPMVPASRATGSFTIDSTGTRHAELEPLAAPDQGQHRGNAQRWLGFGTGVIGLVGLGIGSGYALHSASLSEDAERYRRPGTNVYDEPGFGQNERALEARNIAAISAALGAAALVGGLTIYLTAPQGKKQKSEETLATAALVVSPAGVAFGGQWH